MNDEPSYAIVHFTLKYRIFLLVCSAFAPIIMIALIAWPELSVTMIIAGVLAGGAAVFLMQLFIDIIGVIAETLLPR